MRTIHMGLNTDPAEYAEKAIKNWESTDTDEEEIRDMILYWKKELAKANHLKEEIINAVKEYGKVSLSWSCNGRTRHAMHAQHWAECMPEYKFDIDCNYHCVVSKK